MMRMAMMMTMMMLTMTTMMMVMMMMMTGAQARHQTLAFLRGHTAMT